MSLVPTPETTPEIVKEERRNRWLLRCIAIGVLLIAGGVAVTLYQRGVDSAKQSTILGSIARQDCARAYSSDRSAVVEKAQAIERQSNIDLAGYLLSAGVSTATLTKDKADLEAANAAVLRLPTLASMVEDGYRLDGAKHPPCPG